MATVGTPPGSGPDEPTPVDKITTQQSPFLRLAAELGKRIYEEAFETTIIIRRKTADAGDAGPVDFNNGVILACKQTHAEAIGLYYSTHVFRLTLHSQGINRNRSLEAFCINWLGSMENKHFRLLKHIELDFATLYDISMSKWRTSTRYFHIIIAYLAESTLNRVRERCGLHDALFTVTILSPLSLDDHGTQRHDSRY